MTFLLPCLPYYYGFCSTANLHLLGVEIIQRCAERADSDQAGGEREIRGGGFFHVVHEQFEGWAAEIETQDAGAGEAGEVLHGELGEAAGLLQEEVGLVGAAVVVEPGQVVGVFARAGVDAPPGRRPCRPW